MNKKNIGFLKLFYLTFTLSFLAAVIITLVTIGPDHYFYYKMFGLILFTLQKFSNLFICTGILILLSLSLLSIICKPFIHYVKKSFWNVFTIIVLFIGLCFVANSLLRRFIDLNQWNIFGLSAPLREYRYIFILSLSIVLCSLILFPPAFNKKNFDPSDNFHLRQITILLLVVWLSLNAGLALYKRISLPRRPNIILIYLDALRADHLGCYGYNRDTSPLIDEIAKNGLLCMNVFAQASTTYPSVHSSFTSLYAHNHFNSSIILKREYLTVAEVLKNGGYYTAGFSGSSVVTNIANATRKNPEWGLGGFGQGFDEFDNSVFSDNKNKWLCRDAEELVGKATNWVRKNHQKKFFLLIYLLDTHSLYSPPPFYQRLYDPDYKGNPAVERGDPYPFIRKIGKGRDTGLDKRDIHHFIALYDGEIRYCDDTLRKLYDYLESMRLLDNTLIVITSDHGEEFLEHGHLNHGWGLYNEELLIPLIFYYRRSPLQGTVIDSELLQAIDMVPTILDFAGIGKPKDMQGESILKLAGKGKPQWRQYAFSENPNIDAKAFITKEWKYIHHFNSKAPSGDVSTSELYNLNNDPREKFNRYNIFPDMTHQLYRRIMGMLDERESQRLEKGRSIYLDAPSKEKLRSLGYIQ